MKVPLVFLKMRSFVFLSSRYREQKKGCKKEEDQKSL